MKSKIITERGQALILIALAAVGIFGVVGLAIDGGAKFADQRQAQNAADTAALAAAYAKVDALLAGDSNSPVQCDSGNMVGASDVCTALVLAGLDRADSNGYDNFTDNTVKIYSPPLSGPNAGNAHYVQVIITSDVNTTFARVVGIQQTHNTVLAETFYRDGGDLVESAMIISYDPAPNCSTGGEGGYSVIVNGGATVNLNGGGILLNSQETCGFKIPNCADLNVYSGSINSSGDNILIPDGCTFDPPITTNINQDPIVIPDDIYWPDVPPECSTPATAYNDPPGTDTWHITPGYYTSFPQETLNGNDPTTLVGNKKDIIMDSGVYCVGEDIKWNGNTFNSLDGSSGVTIYMKSGADFSLNLDSPITLYASTSGDYQGYLVIQEGTHTDIGSCTINGGGYLDIEGLIYAPYCDFTINGQAGETAAINAQVVGWTIKINGTNAISFNYDPSNKVVIKSQIGLVR